MVEDSADKSFARVSNSNGLLGMVEELMDSHQMDVWHDQDGRAFATIHTGTHVENLSVRSLSFKHRMRQLFHSHRQRIIPEKSLKEAVGYFEGYAILQGEKQTSSYRVCGDDRAVFIDLGDSDWGYIQVTPGEWNLRYGKGPRFWRSEHTKSLPVPIRGGSDELLRKYLNIDSDEQMALVLAWIIQAMIPDEPYPLLPLSGEQGSAKSTVAKILISLTDPKKAPLRTLPDSERDLLIQARSNQVLAFDNISYLRAGMSDALCRLSTGGGLSTRALYTDDEQVIFESRRPVILTGITDIVNRGDLLDRSVPLELKAIPENKRRLERDFIDQFENDKPAIFGFLLDLLSETLKSRPDITPASYPRMADFARTGEAVSRIIGGHEDSFIGSIQSIKELSSELIVESSPVGVMIRLLMQGQSEWVGRAIDLLRWLNEKSDSEAVKRRDWPKDSTRLSGTLRLLSPSLRTEGIEVNFDTPSRRKITITNVYKYSDSSDTASSQLALDVTDVTDVTDDARFEHI